MERKKYGQAIFLSNLYKVIVYNGSCRKSPYEFSHIHKGFFLKGTVNL